MNDIRDPKFIIALLVIGLFGWAYGENVSDDTMKGALIAAFAGAWGYYLGSSNSSNIVRDQVGKALDIAAAAQPQSPPDVLLKPGETAQAEPRTGGIGDYQETGR